MVGIPVSEVVTDADIAVLFRESRKRRGLSQKNVSDIAVAAGLEWDQSTCSRVERGVRRVLLTEYVALAPHLLLPTVGPVLVDNERAELESLREMRRKVLAVLGVGA